MPDIKGPEFLKVGDKFPSPRASEGIVRVVCEYGKCSHHSDRPDSIHVGAYSTSSFGTSYNEWFIAMMTSDVRGRHGEGLHVCEPGGCSPAPGTPCGEDDAWFERHAIVNQERHWG